MSAPEQEGEGERVIDFLVPIQTISEMNARDHWAKVLRRKKSQQEAVTVIMQNVLRGRKVTLPCTVKLTRIGRRRLDGDNLQSSMKFVRDAVARKLEVDDGSDDITFEYDQKAVVQENYGVNVQIF